MFPSIRRGDHRKCDDHRSRRSPARGRVLRIEELEARHLLTAGPFEAHFDFGTGASPLAGGYTLVTESTSYTAARGFGWQNGELYSRDRGAGTALVRDFNFTRMATFAVDLPNGRYAVDAIYGDMGSYAHDHVGAFLEGSQVDDVTTAAGQVVQRHYEVDVFDGQLTFDLRDLGGSDVNAVIDALDISAIGPPLPWISIGDVTDVEGDTGQRDFAFQVSLSLSTTIDVQVPFGTQNGSAGAGSDYVSQTGTLTIPAGQTSGVIHVPVNGDLDIEPDETFSVVLSNPSGGVLSDAQALGTIVSDDAPKTLSLSVSPSSFSETAGASAATVTLTRTGKVDEAVTVMLSSSDLSELTVPAEVEIPANMAIVNFAVSAVDDMDLDGAQAVTISATATDYVPGSTSVNVTDNEQPPFAGHYDFGTSTSPLQPGYTRITRSTTYNAAQGFGWTAGSIRDHDRGTGTLLARDFNYTPSGTFAVDVPDGRYRIDMLLGDVGRYAHDDVGVYLEGAHVDTVTTAAGQVVGRSFEVEVADSQLTLRLTDLGGGDSNTVIESLDVSWLGPILPTLSINDVAASEGDSGTKDFTFTASLSSASSSDVQVAFVVGDGSATSPGDYTSYGGVLVIPAGQTSGVIHVSVSGDEEVEPDEAFYVHLSNPQGARLIDGEGIGTILTDDVPKTLSLSVSPSSFSETAGASAATVTLTRTGKVDEAVTVSLASSDLSEVTVPAEVEIPAHMAVVNFAVSAVDDMDLDGAQAVTISATATDYTPGSTSVHVTDNEQPPFSAHYDFGTSSSPLSSGYSRVSEVTGYSAAAGFGWLAGTVNSRDRGTVSPLDRDMNYTTDATFAVDLPNGTYRVDVLLGDRAGYGHDDVGVILEGQLRDTVTTNGGQIVSRTFDVQVVDGQLTLRLADLGGGDANCVIEALRVLDSNLPARPGGPWWPVRDEIPGAVFTEGYVSGGITYYDVDSVYQRKTNNIRVLLPSSYDPNQVYQVIYVLPVEPGNSTQYGDGLRTVQSLGLHNTHNVIFVAPSFSETPWYADHISNSAIWEETYFRDVVVPFVEQQYATSGQAADRLLLGFSKSGYGAVSMILRNPDYFGVAAAWDSPLAMSDPGSGYGFLGVLGSRQNFYDNYQITSLIPRQLAHFQGQPPRIALLGYSYDFTRQDHATVDAIMTNYGLPHAYIPGVYRSHVWHSGWIPEIVGQLLAMA